jgi:putative flippase GtrA
MSEVQREVGTAPRLRGSPLKAFEEHAADTRPILLIPAYKPPPSLQPLVKELMDTRAFEAAVIVDDGGGEECASIFERLTETPGVHVLRHVVNLGKGAALKSGLNFAACRYVQSVGVVTADADGQHTAADIVKIAEELRSRTSLLILGSRGFDGDVPLRSRLGNAFTRHILRLVVGHNLHDTQTGLRGIPMAFVPDIVRLKATGYDLELDMLVAGKSAGLQVHEIPISTIYIDDNRSSHFNPLLDSMRVYFVFVRFGAVSLLTAAIDNLVFIFATAMGGGILASQTLARMVAGIFNYYGNKRRVFRSEVRDWVAVPRFWIAVIASGAVSYALIQIFVGYLSMNLIAAKLLAETLLFACNFVIQREFVFAHRPSA